MSHIAGRSHSSNMVSTRQRSKLNKPDSGPPSSANEDILPLSTDSVIESGHESLTSIQIVESMDDSESTDITDKSVPLSVKSAPPPVESALDDLERELFASSDSSDDEDFSFSKKSKHKSDNTSAISLESGSMFMIDRASAAEEHHVESSKLVAAGERKGDNETTRKELL